MRILFLDIDGVCNDHKKQSNDYCTINRMSMVFLNEIVERSYCFIVLASAWRYMILNGAMTLRGFGYLLLTHGASKTTASSLYGVLPADIDVNDPHDRGKLARAWLDANQHTKVVALDDMDCGYRELGIPFVRTDGTVGMTAADAACVVEMFRGT